MCAMHRTWRIPLFSYVMVFNASWTLLALSATNEKTIPHGLLNSGLTVECEIWTRDAIEAEQ